jgi:hypothetical protein
MARCKAGPDKGSDRWRRSRPEEPEATSARRRQLTVGRRWQWVAAARAGGGLGERAAEVTD